MRIQNSQYEKALENVADILGIDKGKAKTPDALLAEVKAKTLEKQAASQNVPLELLQQMEGFRQKAEAFERAQMEQQALAGFRQVQTMHGLGEQDMMEFIGKLEESGINPFVNPNVDLVKEYRNFYFDSILQKQVDAAVQKALGTQQAAANHSTTPGTHSGPSGEGAKANSVNTVAGLEALLSGR